MREEQLSSDGQVPEGVCVVTHPLAASGENATRTLLEILASITTVSLITADLPSESVIWDQHEVIEVASGGVAGSIVRVGAQFINNQIRMCRAIATRNEEVVLFFGGTSYLLPMLLAKLLGRTVVVEPRGDVPLTLRLNWERRYPRFIAKSLAWPVWALERMAYSISDAVITYTPGFARQLNLDPDSDHIYPDGARYVDTGHFKPTTPVEEREDVVGFVGRLDEEKGIRSLAKVAQELPDCITFRFVGSGDLHDWLGRTIQEEREQGSVDISGWVDHEKIPQELNRLKLLVMPSQPTEGLPTTILESMACGTPVYATPVSGVPDVVQEGKTGFLMESATPEEITSQIESILARKDLPEISNNAHKLITEQYSFEAAVSRYENILQQLNNL